MRYTIETEGPLVKVAGSVSVDDILLLRRALEEILSTSEEPLVFELSNMDSAHSAFLSLMLCLLRKAKSLNKSIKFRGMSSKLSSLASISQLYELNSDAFENGNNPD